MNKRIVFRWSSAADRELLRLVACHRPTSPTKWEEIASACGSLPETEGKTITPRACRERFTLLLEKHKKVDREELSR